MRPRAFLRQGLDRDVYQILRKLDNDDDNDQRPDAPPLRTVPAVYDAIQRSNSSLRRQKKKFLEDSIERVLEFRREEARRDGGEEEEDSEAEIEAATNRAHAAAKVDERFLLNRQMAKLWQIDTAKPGGTPDGVRATEGPREQDASRPQPDGDAKGDGEPTETTPSARRPKKRKLESGDGPPSDKRAREDTTEDPSKAAPKKPRSRPFAVDTVRAGPFAGFESLVSDFCTKADLLFNDARASDALYLSKFHGVLVTGPPGSGKRSLVRVMAERLQRPLLRVRPCFYDAEKVDKNLADALDEARALAPCVVLIDRIHDFMPRASGSGHADLRNKSVEGLETMMERIETASLGVEDGSHHRHILVVATTNKEADIDPRALSLLRSVYTMPYPDPATRVAILRALTTHGDRVVDAGFDYAAHAKSTHGYAAGDLLHVVNLAKQAMQMRTWPERLKREQAGGDATGSQPPAPLPPIPLTNEAMASAIQAHVPDSRKEGFNMMPTVTWSQVGALTNVRKQLTNCIIKPIRNPALFEAYGTGTSAGVLLWGPPGCGKTFVAQAVANEAQASFILVNGPELLNKYVGESERSIRELFARARLAAPCIVFFDEMESLVPRRGSSSTDAGTRVVNTLLAELDGVQKRPGVYVIGTTNRPDMIDPAMLRPGRLDKKLFLDLPTEDERVEVLAAVVRTKMPRATEADRAALEKVARDPRCAGFSGADLKGLYEMAVQHRVGRDGEGEGEGEDMAPEEEEERLLADEDWGHALDSLRPSVGADDRERYRVLSKQML